MPPSADTAAPEREADVLRRGLDLLRDRVPPNWEITIEEETRAPRGPRPDAIVRLRGPDGNSVALVVEAKRVLEARDAGWVRDQLDRAIEAMWAEQSAGPPAELVPMVVARYLAPRTRERLSELGVSYADATGNLEVAIEKPALFVRDVGANRDPWRGPGRPRGSFRGPVPARVVRALVDFAPPMTVRELTDRAGTSTGATYRMVELLQREAYIERKPRGPITRVDWRRMLERWSEDYGFATSNPTGSFLEPRGLPELLERLRAEADLRYAVTGSIAAGYFARYAPSRLAMLYVDDLDRAADALDLRQVESGSNVLVAAPVDDFVYERTSVRDGLQIAAPSQVAVDLLTSPGRGPSEAVALLDWMQENEGAWRG